jgi:hypothetical protein
MSISLKLKLGAIEIDYSGPEAFLRENFIDFAAELQKTVGQTAQTTIKTNQSPDALDTTYAKPVSLGMTTNALALRIGCANVRDLFKTALFRLQDGEANAQFPRKSILDEMRTVSSIYNSVMQSNLTKTIKSLLVNKDINEPTTGFYCLTEKARKEIGDRLQTTEG